MSTAADGTAPSHPAGYLPGLDGLRALSVLVVVAFHCGLVDGGWIGVDVFFGISGFLITGLLVAEYGRSGRVALGAFWMRRIRRLVPALVVLLALVAVLVAADQVEVRARDVWGAVTYSTNWVHILGGVSYWDRFATPDPLRHLWSLAIEEQFYLVWPVVAAVILRRGDSARVHLQRVALGGAVISAAVQVIGINAGFSIDRVYQGTDTRAVAFLLGAAFACRGWPPVRTSVTNSTTSILTTLVRVSIPILVIAAIWLPGDREWVFNGALIAVSGAGALVVWWSSSTGGGPLHRPWLRAIGRWSYGIYLFHWPLAVSDRLSTTPVVLRFVIVTVVSTALAALSFRFVESPIRHRRVRRNLLPALGIVATAVVVITLVISTPATPALDTTVTLAPGNPGGSGDDGGSDAVTRVMVFGDSIPAMAADELDTVARELGIELEVRAEPGCVPSEDERDQYGNPGCVDFLRDTPARATGIGIDVAVIWWGGTGEGFQERDVPYYFCDSNALDVSRDRIRRLVDYFAGVAEVVLVTPVPRTDLDAAAAAGTACEIDAYLDVATETGASVVDLRDLVCPSFPDDCERVTRYDGLHYNGESAITVAREILGRVVN